MDVDRARGLGPGVFLEVLEVSLHELEIADALIHGRCPLARVSARSQLLLEIDPRVSGALLASRNSPRQRDIATHWLSNQRQFPV
jgi:hypothetical protein